MEYECFVELVLSIIFGCMDYGHAYAHAPTYPTIFISVPRPLRFQSNPRSHFGI
jgi:hypothetical protein